MNYLFIVGKYYPKPLANSVCCQNIIDVITSKGNEVDVICFEDEEEKLDTYHGCKIHYVKPDAKLRNKYKADYYAGTKQGKKYFRRMKMHSLLRKILTFNYEPFYSFSFPRRIRKLVNNLAQEKKIDCIVTCFHPFDGVYAVYKAKKKGKLSNIPWVIYTLDNVDNIKLRKIFKSRSTHNYWCKKFLKYSDGLIYMSSRKKDYDVKLFEPFKDKLFEADLPSLIVYKLLDNKNNKDIWTYLGAMDKDHYDPHFTIEFLSQCDEFSNSEYHFYSRGNQVGYLLEKQKEYPNNLFVNNYVCKEEVEKIMNNSTGFISLKTSNYISMKTFEYIASGKPIIHFSSSSNDPNAVYLEKYPRAVVIKESEYRNGKYTKDDFSKDLIRAKKSIITEKEINELFFMNKPEFTAKIIEEIASKKD